MPRIKTTGKPAHIISSFYTLNRIAIGVMVRRLLGRPLVADWQRDTEIGNLFWRHQFNRALAFDDMADGRAYFDSVLTFTDEVFDVRTRPAAPGWPKGTWYEPKDVQLPATMLYLHGGGYTFNSAVSARYAETLAGILRLPLYMPDYRLTPEHPHPAQIEDAVSAYRALLDDGTPPERLVVLGDSAGGHLTLMLLVGAARLGLPQPALAVGLCPWTDIGDRGDSLRDNDRYDLVQGYMAIKFGEWLQGGGPCTREELSPIWQDYSGLAPIYMQGGGKEVLIDMIRDFAAVLRSQNADAVLHEWEHMTHNFQANGDTLPESRDALARIARAIRHCTTNGGGLATAFGPGAAAG